MGYLKPILLYKGIKLHALHIVPSFPCRYVLPELSTHSCFGGYYIRRMFVDIEQNQVHLLRYTLL